MNSKQVIRILLIEDNPGDIHLIRRNLDLIGANYQMEVCTDGEAGLDYLNSLPEDSSTWPHMVLLDLNLPKMHGREVLEAIKSNDRLKCIPVIIFTSSNQSQEIAQMYCSNANCFVEKPSNLDEYNKVVRMVWDFWSHTASLPERQS